MKVIDIENIEDGYKLEKLQSFLIAQSKSIVNTQAEINRILDLDIDDISVVVRYVDEELILFVGTHENMRKAVEDGDL